VDRKANAELKVSSRAILGLLFVALFGAVAFPLYAQVAGARLAGTVTDSTGGVIPGAQVRIENTANHLARELVTNQSGFYSAPNLSPGPYTVTVSAKGFQSEVRRGLTLTVGADVEVNLTLAIGRGSDSIEVQGEAPAVEMYNAALSAVVNGQTVRELPLNARDWTQLAALEPGVAQIRTQTTPTDFLIRGGHGLGTQMTVSGGRHSRTITALMGSASMTTRMEAQAARSATTWELMPSRSSPWSPPTLRRITAKLPGGAST